MGILATLSPFLHMLHGSYPQRRRSIASETLDLMPAHILLDTRKLEQELQVFYHDLQPEDVRSMLKDSTCKQVSRLTNDDFRITKLLKQMCLDQLAENSDMKEGFASFVHAIAAVKSLYIVVLEKSIGDLKSPYFQNEVPIVGINCMGGVGKKTLASDLCNDFIIKGCFQILLLIALSESPYVQGLIEMMWDGIVGWHRNVEDACMHLQIQLPRQSNSTPLILNHVGFRENMEKLLFQVGGYKTLLTSRHRFFISRNRSIQFNQLSSLGQGDALSLFCLHEEPYVVWEIAKSKLSKGELVSDNHLDSSTPVLDFQWTKKPVQMHFCISVHFCIFGFMFGSWLEAFTILLELASRNLWNLISKYRSTAATFNGYAAEHYFSQYYAIGELVLHLGGKGIAFQRSRFACSGEGGYFACR